MNWQQRLNDAMKIKALLLEENGSKLPTKKVPLERFKNKLKIINCEIAKCKEATMSLKDKLRLKKKIFLVLPKGQFPKEKKLFKQN